MSGRCDSCGEVGNVWCGGCLGDPDVHNLEVRLSAAKQRAERAEAEALALVKLAMDVKDERDEARADARTLREELARVAAEREDYRTRLFSCARPIEDLREGVARLGVALEAALASQPSPATGVVGTEAGE